MPIYEYGCESCGHVFEEIQRFSDPDPEQCPQCGKGNVRRLISNTSFHLKGGGWYETNYEKTPSSKGSSSPVGESSASTSPPSSSDVSTSSAPASTPTTGPGKSTSTSNDAA